MILKHGKTRLLVNCFLDEGSDTTYANEDVVETLGIRAPKEQVTINVANNQKVQLMAATVEVGIESIDGKVDTSIVVKTSDKICGGMKPTNWLEIQHQWDHLKDMPFPKLATKGFIDVLLDSDYYNLMFPMREIRGKEDEPSGRLCPLGWTAIGRIGKSEQSPQSANTGCLHTFRAQLASPDMLPTVLESNEADLNTTLFCLNCLSTLLVSKFTIMIKKKRTKRFWDLETIGITVQTSEKGGMTLDEKLAWKKVEQSLTYNGERYEVAVPWKSERPSLENNRPIAERRLKLVENKLLKHTHLAHAYQGE